MTAETLQQSEGRVAYAALVTLVVVRDLADDEISKGIKRRSSRVDLASMGARYAVSRCYARADSRSRVDPSKGSDPGQTQSQTPGSSREGQGVES